MLFRFERFGLRAPLNGADGIARANPSAFLAPQRFIHRTAIPRMRFGIPPMILGDAILRVVNETSARATARRRRFASRQLLVTCG
jgi:hypothetical protein